MAGQATGRDLHIDRPLSNIMMRYRPSGFIADQIAPTVTVNKQSDSYYVWDIADVFRVIDDYRAPGREALTMTRTMSSATFFCKNHALKFPLVYEDLVNADAKELFLSRQAIGEQIKDQLMLNMEYRVAMQCTSGSNVGSYTTVASAWNDPTVGNSDPISDIDTAIENVKGVTGIRPNSVIFGHNAWLTFRRHDQIIKAIFGNSAVGSARVPQEGGVKALFDIERVLIGGAMYNSNPENQSASLSELWDDQVLVYYAPLTPRKDIASFMYSFNWDKVKGFNMQAQIFDSPKKGAEEVQLGYYQDEKITGNTLAFLITGCNSSQ